MAVKLQKNLQILNNELAEWQSLRTETENLLALITQSLQEQDRSLEQEFAEKLLLLSKQFKQLEFAVLFDSQYDRHGVWLSIHAGTGGVDAQDWALMLQRLYLRFAEKMKWQSEILDVNSGNEAGIKNCLIKIDGRFAYGYLKGEAGVHRLVRISPFDSENLRQTSFALVEIIPQLAKDSAAVVKDEELELEFFRSSGPGGQNVNKTSSAVRITHLPTGISVVSQTERSQHQNRANALSVLQAKLQQLKNQQQADTAKTLRGEVQTAEWGKQIRSYVLQPYKLVKDHRTNFETTAVQAVLDGDLKDFIAAYLKSLKHKT